jgi:hypothetical protein
VPPGEIFQLQVDYARATVVSITETAIELIASNVVEVP